MNDVVTQINVTGDTTLYAVWVLDSYTVTYDANGGKFSDNLTSHSVEAEPGYYSVDYDQNPTREGYRFDCWTMDGQQEVWSLNLSSDVTLMAKWRKLYTLTFDAGEGYFPMKQQHTMQIQRPQGYNTLRSLVPDPVREGYAFAGWTYEGRYPASVSVNADMTFTAAWVQETFYTVTLDPAGGVFANGDTNRSTQIPDGTILNLNSFTDPPTKEGYLFTGWMSGGRMVSKKVIQADTTFTAQWAPAIAVTYDTNGGYFYSYGPGGISSEGTSLTVWAPVGLYTIGDRVSEPYRDGWSFAGWTVNDEYVTQVDLTEAVTVKASWTRGVTVTYDANGGGWGWDEQSQTWTETQRSQGAQTGLYNVGCRYPDEREGYSMLGWSADPNAETAQPKLTVTLEGDTTFYMIWAEDATVIYDGNGGGWGWDEQSQTYTDGTEKTWNERAGSYNISWIEPWKDGYVFKGWTVEGSSALLHGGDDYVLPVGGTVRFTAQWERMSVVTYDANGGGWGEGTVDGHYDEVTRTRREQVGRTIYIGMEYPWRDGYECVGWTTDRAGTTVAPNSLVLTDTDVTYYAKWAKRITMTYDANGGSFGGEYGPDDRDTEFIHYREQREDDCWLDGWEPHRDGYEFVGWSRTQSTEWSIALVEENPIVLTAGELASGNVTLYAVWARSITVVYESNGRGSWDGQASFTRETRLDNFGIDGWRPWEEDSPYYSIGYATTPDGAKAYDFDQTVTDIGNNSPLIQNGTDDRGNTYSYVTFYAVWDRYPTVTYDANGGGWGELENGNFEQTTREQWSPGGPIYYVGEQDPWREGYEFTGWVDAAVNGNPAPEQINLTEDVTYYASWAKHTLVTYDANGGGWGWNGQRFEDGTVREDNGALTGLYHVIGWEPYQEGFIFRGWTDSAEKAASANPVPLLNDGETYPLTENEHTTFYAVWERAPLVTYDLNGGRFLYYGEGGKTAEYVYDPENYQVRNSPVEKEGCTFLGWSTNPEATTAKTHFVTNITEDTTFYAIWQAKIAVTLDGNGGTVYNGRSGSGESILTAYFNQGEMIDVSNEFDAYREGWALDGWTDENNNYVTYIQARSDMILTAQWVEAVELTLDANGGFFYNTGRTGTGENPTTMSFDMQRGVQYLNMTTMPKREGWVFEGWTLERDDDVLVNRVKLYDDLTVYAKWSQPDTSYTLTFDAGSGSFTDGTHAKTVNAAGDYNVDAAEKPKWSGHTFINWADSARESAYSWISVEENTTLTAVWEDGEYYNLTLDACGGQFRNGEGVMNYYSYPAGALIEPRWYEEPTREGYIFDGWAYEGDPIQNIVLDEDVTLTAIWRDPPPVPESVTITADKENLNDLVLSEENNYSVDVTFTGTAVWTNQQAEQDADYTWYQTWDGLYWSQIFSGDNVPYTGKSYTAHFDGGESRYFRMCVNGVAWSNIIEVSTRHESEGPKARVVYHANGGVFTNYDNSMQSETYVRYEYVGSQSRTDVQTPQRDGYIFRGWKYNADGTGYFISQFTVGQTNEFYAVWEAGEARTATVTLDANGGVFDPDYDRTQIRTISLQEGSLFYVDGNTGNLVKGGYILTGWTVTDANGTTTIGVHDSILLSGDTSLTAQWAKACVVNLMGNGGTFDFWDNYHCMQVTGESARLEYPEGYEYTVNQHTPSRDGYSMTGWTMNGMPVAWDETIVLHGDVTLDAQWARFCTISIDGNGGVFTVWDDDQQMEITTGTVTCEYPENSEYYVYSNTPSRDGYMLSGWTVNGIPFDGYDYVIQGDVTLVAQWTRLYTVTIDGNGGTFEVWNDDQQAYVNVETISEPYAENSEYYVYWHTPSRDGYTLSGWTVNGVLWEDESEPIAVTDGLTLVAQWQEEGQTNNTIEIDSYSWSGSDLICYLTVTVDADTAAAGYRCGVDVSTDPYFNDGNGPQNNMASTEVLTNGSVTVTIDNARLVPNVTYYLRGHLSDNGEPPMTIVVGESMIPVTGSSDGFSVIPDVNEETTIMSQGNVRHMFTAPAAGLYTVSLSGGFGYVVAYRADGTEIGNLYSSLEDISLNEDETIYFFGFTMNEEGTLTILSDTESDDTDSGNEEIEMAMIPAEEDLVIVESLEPAAAAVPAEEELTEADAAEMEPAEADAKEPEVTEPEAEVSEYEEPVNEEPEIEEPEYTEPEAEEPEYTEPEATEPEMTEPESVVEEVPEGYEEADSGYEESAGEVIEEETTEEMPEE